MSKIERKIKDLCKEKGAKIESIEHLLDYYEKSLGWNKKHALEYTLKLFEDGTIDSIMVISGKGGKKSDTD